MTRVPPPSAESIVTLPPSAAHRSAMPCRPVPIDAVAGSKPLPLSWTVKVRYLPSWLSVTRAVDACAYSATFCQRFQHREVDRGLDLLRVPADPVRLDRCRQRRLAGLRLERCPQPQVGEQRRVDPAGQIPQFLQRAGGGAFRFRKQLAGLRGRGLHHLAAEAAPAPRSAREGRTPPATRPQRGLGVT